jgi:transposase
MSLPTRELAPIPEETVRVARAAFPKGNPYMQMRDVLGNFYRDSAFASLFPTRGRPAESPGLLCLVTVLQFAEDLTDRQAADAVRARIDWKYALGLELTDVGFDFTLLSDFRRRLLEGGLETQLLDAMLSRFKELDLLAAGGTQRTDSTYIVGAIRRLNRLELAGETLRHLLNQLALVAPAWVRAQVPQAWYTRYDTRFEATRLPAKEHEQQALAEQIGYDGISLLMVLYAADTPAWFRELPAVETTRRIWLQQFYVHDGQVRWRAIADLPPGAQLVESPFDMAARFSYKRSTEWVGYKVHLTECCDPTRPHLLTHVVTTLATTGDVEETIPLHEALVDKGLAPTRHLVDSGYTGAQEAVSAQVQGIDLYGPFRTDTSWQARTEGAYAVSAFHIDWEAQQAHCPQGQLSLGWAESTDRHGQAVVIIRFPTAVCRACPARARCTKTIKNPRSLKIRPQRLHEALQQGRQRQLTDEFKAAYTLRAGVEGTVSQGVRAFGLRRTRYIGLERTHLQHVATAAAINLVRFHAWHEQQPLAPTRTSRFAALAA